MSAVFISYRRSGAKHSAYRLKDKLKQVFSADKVFIDLEDIDAGLPFADVIKDTISRCSVILIVIGPKWLEMQDMQGSRRLDAADDWVRQEIETAMASDARVIPVLVDGAAELKTEQVPESLRGFAGLQAMRLSEEETYWHFDVDRLIKKILSVDPDLRPDDDDEKQAGFSGKAVAALVIAGILFVVIGVDDGTLDQDSVVAAIVFSIVALALSIWGFKDIQVGRARGRAVAIGGIVLASLVALASIGSLPDPAPQTVASVQQGQGGTTVPQTGADAFDPNLLPPTAAIPSSDQVADIAGAWVGSDGSRYKVTQYGDRFEFLEFEPSGAISATGSGIIRGNSVESEFQATDQTQGRGRFTLSGDGRVLTGSYRVNSTGESFTVILSRR